MVVVSTLTLHITPIVKYKEVRYLSYSGLQALYFVLPRPQCFIFCFCVSMCAHVGSLGCMYVSMGVCLCLQICGVLTNLSVQQKGTKSSHLGTAQTCNIFICTGYPPEHSKCVDLRRPPKLAQLTTLEL